MTAPTHIVTGLATVVVVGRVTGVTPDAVGLMAVIFGSLAPDIDGTGVITRPGTILRQLIGRGPANLLDAVFEFIAAAVHFLFGHRGFIHSPLLAFSIFGLGGYLGKPWLEWFGIGYATHLLGDALTVGGIPIWSPFSSRRVSLSHMRTGSRQEYALAVVMLLWTCVFGWRLLPEDVKLTHQMIYEKLAASQSQSPT
jgi:inner membrane protein